jgi:hypothetical protein
LFLKRIYIHGKLIISSFVTQESRMPLLILGTLTLVLPKFQEPIALEGICLFSNGSCRKMSLLELSVCLSRFSGVILVYLVEGVGCVLGRADAKTCKEKKKLCGGFVYLVWPRISF